MLICEVKGGNKFQRELAQCVVGHCIEEMMPSLRKIDLTVSIQTLKPLHATLGKGLYATCEEIDHRQYHIKVNRYIKPNTFVRYLSHEMVHVMQYATGLLKDCYMAHKQGVVIWQGKECLEGNYSYPEQPWEHQAFTMQEILADKFFYDLGVSQSMRRKISYRDLVNNYIIA